MTDLRSIRTDVVGSLLRPDYLMEIWQRHGRGEAGDAELGAAQDQAVREAVALQEACGIEVVTDGEYRRLNFQDSFAYSIEGFDADKVSIDWYLKEIEGIQPLRRWDRPMEERGPAVSQRRPVRERLRLVRNQPLEEYRFVSGVASRPVKVTLISPDRIWQRWDYETSTPVYAGPEDFVGHVADIEHEMVRQLVEAGCRYVQIDAPSYTAYVDGPSLARMRQRGEDPIQSFARSLKADNTVIQGFPGVTFGLHLCRGNQRSMWHREGSYDAIAERLFNELAHDRFLLEYDSERAGSFAPLRFLPKGKTVVLGLVSTKIPQLERLEDLRRRIEEASRYAPLEQLAISPQCGFASAPPGNAISADDQRRKLELIAEAARRVWGV